MKVGFIFVSRTDDEEMFIKVRKLLPPQQLKNKFKLDAQTSNIIENNRIELQNIITGKSDKFLIIIGPCSVHDMNSICSYAGQIAQIYETLHSKIFIILRVFTAKPRTDLNEYKGLVHQPDISQGENLYDGLIEQRKLLIKLIKLYHLSIADEFLYPQLFNYTDDLISYYVLGARTSDSQPHKLFLSGVDLPVGVKNPLYTSDVSQNLSAISSPHKLFLNGYETKTTGNKLAHIVLRGTKFAPNYHYEDLLGVIKNYPPVKNKLIIVDTNHSNSDKNYLEQSRIAKEVLFNRSQNELIKKYVRGLMIESFLLDGKQNENGTDFGKSITDPCLGLLKTKALLNEIYQLL